MTGMKVGVVFGLFSFSLYLLVGVVWTVLVELGGALCDSDNPAYSIASNTGNIRLPIKLDNTTVLLLEYYSRCSGPNPMGHYITDSRTAIDAFNFTLSKYCIYTTPSRQTASLMQTTLTNMTQSIASLDSELACSHIQNDLLGIINTGFCGDFYSGVFVVWSAQLVVSFSLFWLVVLATIAYQYHDETRKNKEKGLVAPEVDPAVDVRIHMHGSDETADVLHEHATHKGHDHNHHDHHGTSDAVPLKHESLQPHHNKVQVESDLEEFIL
mmetsp:Transcript_31827/g.43432  ORF Transcript_31827/g.43432 Transcript_31827/m.43432 type:complete len:269 (-) Transcript_31827:1131-1937(-)